MINSCIPVCQTRVEAVEKCEAGYDISAQLAFVFISVGYT